MVLAFFLPPCVVAFTAALRGGESEHIEFMTVGKGRDVGMLQIEVFESKISAGTAISMTARDSFRVFESMDLSRLLSYWHTCGGFYVSPGMTCLSSLMTQRFAMLVLPSCLAFSG